MLDPVLETLIKNVTMRKSQFLNNITIKGYKAFEFPTIHQETKSSQLGVETKFVVTFSLHREPSGYLIRYHLVCAVLVFIGSISFFIEPKIVPGRSGLLVTLFLVLAAFFSNAQVTQTLKKWHYGMFHYSILINIIHYTFSKKLKTAVLMP